MLVGYARVSTLDQNLDLQFDALKEAGCEKIFTEKASGAKSDRPELNKALEFIRSGDTLVVWKLDRLGRSIRQLIDTVNILNERGIGLRSLKESIDTATSSGKLVFHIFCALAEFERDVIRERTHAGLAAARARGRKGGRKKAITPDKFSMALGLYQKRELSVDTICENLGVNRRTFYNYLAEHQKK
jgi:DNA invertase Pin-like site-specific DNA recombinase